MSRSGSKFWTALSGIPPIVIGVAGALILALEGHILGTFLIVLLVAIHRYSALILRGGLATTQAADWTAVRAITTFCCLGLPFYVALTIG